jgi:hypothetical protein
MKLTIKRTLGKLEQFNIRIPAPLKTRLDATRKRAEARGVDFVATLSATLDEFEQALSAQLRDNAQSGSNIATESVAASLQSNGTNPSTLSAAPHRTEDE